MPDKQPHPTPAPCIAGPAANVVKKGPREERYERRRQAWRGFEVFQEMGEIWGVSVSQQMFFAIRPDIYLKIMKSDVYGNCIIKQ